jgi:hypothetical protein
MEDRAKLYRRVDRANPPTPDASRSESVPETPLEVIRGRVSSLQLSRSRVMRELKSSENPRYKALMVKALADLDAQLSALSAINASLRASAPDAADTAVTAHAVAVFGSRGRATDWLGTPNHLFGGKSPEEYMIGGGAEEVEMILVRIEYGVFS